MRATSCVFVLSLVGCGEDAPSTISTPTGRSDPDAPQAVETDRCDSGHAAEHRKRYANICRDGVETAWDRLATLGGPASDASALEGVRIRVTSAGVETRGETTSAPADIERIVGEQIEVAEQNAKREGKPPPTRFVLEIDREASMTIVDATARALLAAGFGEGVLALAAAERSSPPVHAEIHRRLAAEIEGMGPDERAVRVSGALERLVGDCAAVAEAFSAVATVAPSERCSALTEQLPDAFVSCGCPSTEPELMTWIQVMHGTDTAYVHAQPVRLVLAPTSVERTEKLWGELVASRRDSLAQLEIPARPK